MGARARDWLAELPGTRAFAVTADGATWHTRGPDAARSGRPAPARG
jgi:thiamine biosynthesis lipoprotein